MNSTRIFLGILSVAVLATPALAAQAAPNCEEWNTAEFFETATIEDVTACLDAGADPMAGSSSLEAGELGSGDTIRSNGAYEDGYSYVGRAGQEVVVELRSSDFDTYLIVESPSGERFVNDDYQGDTGRSLLSLSLDETGEYRFLVSSFSSGGSGPYTLHIGNGGRTPLHLAAQNNANPAVIGALLTAGAGLETRDDDGRTPLYLAAWYNANLATIEALLAGGADPDVRDDDGRTPMYWATVYASPAVEALIAAGANLDERDEYGGTPLHRASSPAVVEALIAGGANLEARDDDGYTPLHGAARFNANLAKIGALLAAGADLEARNDGLTPMHYAAQNNAEPAVLETLIAAGANLGARDDSDNTPLHWAAVGSDVGEHYDPANLEALIAAGADLEARNQDGSTPLHRAAAYGHINYLSGVHYHGGDAIEALLDAGADWMPRNAAGETPPCANNL